MNFINGISSFVKSLQDLFNDYIGDPSDLWMPGTKTALSYANSAYQHIHMPGYIWPNDCALVTCAAAAADNTFGDFVELVGDGDITDPFDCHWVNVSGVSANQTYIVELHRVESGAGLQNSIQFLTSFSVTRVDNFSRTMQVYVQMPAIAGGSRIGVRTKSNSTNADTISLNIHYHEYEV